ncbi:TRAP transporter small permease [Alkalihalobacillus sp. 1P02AB]|uniref:TRAP transporter small permease n=1 Tax=Alkalihalobacillus sp. 1P02AB TaxID=3132260 RepID=UPI0039A4C075
MKVLSKVSFIVDLICRHLISYLLFVIFIAMFIQVTARFVFNTGTFWTDELARFSVIWLVFLGAAVTIKDKSMIKIDLVQNLKPKINGFLNKFKLLYSFIFSVMLIVIGWQTMLLVIAQRSPNIGISMSYIYAALPVACIIMAFHLLYLLLQKNKKGEELK